MNHWIFKRDEFHLLEEEFEDALRLHDSNPASQSFELEEGVIKEQIDTEEALEIEMVLKFGSEWMEISEYNFEDITDLPLKESLIRDSDRHPLYRKTLNWAMKTCIWSKHEYFEKKRLDRDIYRIFINIYLIPIKLSFAQNEQNSEDTFANDIAIKEYELTLIYLDRVLESLSRLIKRQIHTDKVEPLFKEGLFIKAAITANYEALSSSNYSSL